MLQLNVQIEESFDEETSKFITSESFVLELEHSLVSLSKWEAKWEIPFLGDEVKTHDQVVDYINMMVVSGNPPEEILDKLSEKNFTEIHKYINTNMSAAKVKDRPGNTSPDVLTAELIYYWMISLGIPFECQYWHLNRLLALIKVCNYKNAPKEKMSKGDMIAQRRALNEERRKKHNTRG